LQRRYVAIQRAQADAEIGNQHGAAYRVAMTPQQLNQIEQAPGARQTALLITRYAVL
jgi:hypothetical protein